MISVLFSINPIIIRVVSLLLVFITSSFIFWRKGREEHYEINELFDGYILSSFFGLLAARVIYVFLNINNFGFNIIKWFDFFHNPGFNLIIGVVVASFYLHRFSVKKKWDSFEVLDFWVTGISLGLFIYYIGMFFEGVGYGYQTNMPWGVVFPQLIDPHHPVQLYTAFFYLFLYFYLSRVEYNYRTFSWYRYGKKTAQTGFLTSAFLILMAFFSFFISFFRPVSIEFFDLTSSSGLNIDIITSILVFIVGLFLLYSRSGRPLPILGNKKPKAIRTKLEDLNEQLD